MNKMRYVVAAVAASLVWTGHVPAGELDPVAAPAPTMHTLEEIYQKLLSMEQLLASVEQRMQAADQYPVIGDGYNVKMILIPAGSFVMGATTNVGHELIADAVPQHTVQVSAFFMDQEEVFKMSWARVYTWATTNRGYMFDNAGSAADEYEKPVYTVSWYDAVKWCNARSEHDGFTPCYTVDGLPFRTGVNTNIVCNWSANGYRLPTEAEWEKASRGGVAGHRFPWDDADTIHNALRAVYRSDPATYTYDTGSGNSPSGPESASAWWWRGCQRHRYGLVAMAGNVSEWCWDRYDPTYYTNSPGTDPHGPSGPLTARVLRGGSWRDDASFARCANRVSADPTTANDTIGFRTVRIAVQP